jgi:hypothetical protein
LFEFYEVYLSVTENNQQSLSYSIGQKMLCKTLMRLIAISLDPTHVLSYLKDIEEKKKKKNRKEKKKKN